MVRKDIQAIFEASRKKCLRDNPSINENFLDKYSQDIDLFFEKADYLIDNSTKLYIFPDGLELRTSYRDQSVAIKLYFDIFKESHELFFTVLSSDVYNIASFELDEIKEYFKEN